METTSTSTSERVTVTITRGILLPIGARIDGQYKGNPGETYGLDPASARFLIWHGEGVRQGDPYPLDETLVLACPRQAFTLRGGAFYAGQTVWLPRWFVERERGTGLVGDPPPPPVLPAMADAAKRAVLDRRLDRQRARAHAYLESLT